MDDNELLLLELRRRWDFKKDRGALRIAIEIGGDKPWVHAAEREFILHYFEMGKPPRERIHRPDERWRNWCLWCVVELERINTGRGDDPNEMFGNWARWRPGMKPVKKRAKAIQDLITSGMLKIAVDVFIQDDWDLISERQFEMFAKLKGLKQRDLRDQLN